MRGRLASFTLIELLTVISIIAILASVVIYAGLGVLAKGARSRASAEVAAMSAALESYKTDNGIYPQSDGMLLTNLYASTDPSTTGTGNTNATVLYSALSGRVDVDHAPAAGTKSYMTFKANQTSPTGVTPSWVKDPWGNAYQYSTGDNKSPEVSTPYNGAGFFDLYSSGNQKGTGMDTNKFVNNWGV